MDNPYSMLGSAANFQAHTANSLHEELRKPSFIKLNDKPTSFQNPYLDLSDYNRAESELGAYKNSRKGSIGRSMLSSAGAGASAGAAIGTAVAPGLGTIIGGLGGAMYGAQIGLGIGLLGKDKADKRIKNRQATLDKTLQSRIGNFNAMNEGYQQTRSSMERFDAINEQNYLNAMNIYG